MFRQGDIYIDSVESVPPLSIPKDDGVLIDGELTGHSHRIENERLAKVFSHGNEFFVIISAPGTAIVHPEHDRINLLPGTYRVWRQREFDPMSGTRDWGYTTQHVSTEPYRFVVD